MEKLLYKIPEVCEATGYSRAFIYNQIQLDLIPVIRVGRTVRIHRDELNKWILNRGSNV